MLGPAERCGSTLQTLRTGVKSDAKIAIANP